MHGVQQDNTTLQSEKPLHSNKWNHLLKIYVFLETISSLKTHQTSNLQFHLGIIFRIVLFLQDAKAPSSRS